MTTGEKTKGGPSTGRDKRLAEALRANLQKRKSQARSRRAGEPDARPDGVEAAAKPDR